MLEQIIKDQVNLIFKKYKISKNEIENNLREYLDKFPHLKQKWANAENLNDIYRTAEFKKLIKNFSKNLYFSLRTYQKNGRDVNSHISTKERQPYINEFLKQLEPQLNKSENVIDLGGGLFPMQMPLEFMKKFNNYIWIDKDQTSYQKLKKYKLQNSLNNMHLYNDSFDENPWEVYLPENIKYFDFAFMLKLIPVVERQEPDLIDKLTNVPAKMFLVTGSKEAMVKKVDISFREKKTINNFIKLTNKKILSEINIENEFGYVIS